MPEIAMQFMNKKPAITAGFFITLLGSKG